MKARAALAFVLAVTLLWDKSPEPDIAYYNIYVGNYSRNYTALYRADNNTAKLWQDAGTTRFYSVTAVNTSGLESDFSNEVSNTRPTIIPPKLDIQLSPPWIVLSWDNVPGQTYRVACKRSVYEGDWEYLSDDLTGTGEQLMWHEFAVSLFRIYRVEVR